MNIQIIPAFIVTKAVSFAPKGIAVEDVQAKLVSVIKSELGKSTVKSSKDGFAKVSKTLEVSYSQSRVLKLNDDADVMPVKFYRFCEHARKTQADFGIECETVIPKGLQEWLSKVVGNMTVGKTVDAKTETVKA